MTRTVQSAVVFLTCVSFGATANGQRFQGLGDLPGGAFESLAANLSGDGKFVIGSSLNETDYEAFVWTEATGMVGLGVVPGSSISRGLAVSNEGGTAVGLHFVTDVSRAQAFQWRTGGNPVSFDPFPAETSDRLAVGLSADGGTIVGGYRLGLFGDHFAYRWNGDGLTEIGRGSASGVSANGEVVVGFTQSPAGKSEAFRWTAESGAIGLGELPGGDDFSTANGVSADGQVVIGVSEGAEGTEAFRWTGDGGMVGLGDLPGGLMSSSALDTTADGRIVVGISGARYEGPGEIPDPSPFIWDKAHGMRNLVDVLTSDYGLSGTLAGWNLDEATAISDDGMVIVGNGVNPDGNREAWIVTLVPEPSTVTLGNLAVLGVLLGKRRLSQT